MPRLHRLLSTPSEPFADPALVVLLHGLGSNEEDLFAFVPELDPRLNVAALRAPHLYAYGGFAWFDVQWTETTLRFDGDQSLESVGLLADEVAELQNSLGVAPERTIVGGFSQGSMMSLGLLLRRPELLGGAVLLSCSLIPQMVDSERPIAQRIFQSHGTMDPVLPVQLGRQVRDLLLARQASLEYHEYAMAHEVNLACLRDMKNWIASYFQA